MSKFTVVVCDGPYGKQRIYSALRFVLGALFDDHEVNLFLFEDAVITAKAGQDPQEYPAEKDARLPNAEIMLREAMKNGAKVIACGACCQERGISPDEIIEDITLGTILDLVEWVDEADKVVNF
ncbi:DsrE family protein [bacterium]|nr:DsrE family protein [bacterium]MBU1024799.1 DsrE family protein [bacterium]